MHSCRYFEVLEMVRKLLMASVLIFRMIFVYLTLHTYMHTHIHKYIHTYTNTYIIYIHTGTLRCLRWSGSC